MGWGAFRKLTWKRNVETGACEGAVLPGAHTGDSAHGTCRPGAGWAQEGDASRCLDFRPEHLRERTRREEQVESKTEISVWDSHPPKNFKRMAGRVRLELRRAVRDGDVNVGRQVGVQPPGSALSLPANALLPAGL